MARVFDDASSQYLEATATPAGADPTTLTMAFWFKTDDLTSDQTGLSLADADSGLGYLSLAYDTTNDKTTFEVLDSAGNGGTCFTATSNSVTAGTWYHLCGVQRAANDREVYLDAGDSGTNTFDMVAGFALDTVSIGRNGDSTPSDYFSGSLAEAAIWDINLTDPEIAMLAAGVSPLLVRPGNLVFYVPLVRDADQDIIGGLSMAPAASPTVGAHPRIYYPSYPLSPGLAIAAAATGNPPPPMVIRPHYPKSILTYF